jgi:hypothetical protein
MFHGRGIGSPSSVAKRTHPGRHAWVTRKGHSYQGGKLIHALPVKHPLEDQIIHLELSASHEPLVVALECLPVACIFNSRLPSLLVD